MRKTVFAVFALVALSSLSAEEVSRIPIATKQIIYGIAPFDGSKYLATFVPESRKTIHLIAGFDHALTVLLSDVYYWPISAEYRADFQAVNLPLTGKLSVYRGSELVEELQRTEYAYYFPLGPSAEPTKLVYGEALRTLMEAAVREPSIASTFQGPFSGYVVNLDKGRYRLVFSTENDGRVFTLEKELTVFPSLAQGVTYEIIPEDKWTVSSTSESWNSRIYLKSGQTIFLKTFPASLFGAADYDLMARPNKPTAGIGLENSALWVKETVALENILDAEMLIEASSRQIKVRPVGFVVQQNSGSALGYSIVPYADTAVPPVMPSFLAYRLTAPPQGIEVLLSVSKGKAGSERMMRSLNTRDDFLSGLGIILPLFLLLVRWILHLADLRSAIQGTQKGD